MDKNGKISRIYFKHFKGGGGYFNHEYNSSKLWPAVNHRSEIEEQTLYSCCYSFYPCLESEFSQLQFRILTLTQSQRGNDLVVPVDQLRVLYVFERECYVKRPSVLAIVIDLELKSLIASIVP